MNWSEITPDDWAGLIFYGAIATYVAIMIPKLFRGSFMAAIGALLFWGIVFLGAVTAYAYRAELRAVGERVVAVLVPGTAIETGAKEVTVFRRPDGQFAVNGSVDGRKVTFLLDTGASAVVLRAEDAAKLGIPIHRLAYDVDVSTANGRTMAAEIEIPRLAIGPIVEDNVHALVARPGALHENLLGMSFLGDLASFSMTSDRLVMRGK